MRSWWPVLQGGDRGRSLRHFIESWSSDWLSLLTCRHRASLGFLGFLVMGRKHTNLMGIVIKASAFGLPFLAPHKHTC